MRWFEVPNKNQGLDYHVVRGSWPLARFRLTNRILIATLASVYNPVYEHAVFNRSIICQQGFCGVANLEVHNWREFVSELTLIDLAPTERLMIGCPVPIWLWTPAAKSQDAHPSHWKSPMHKPHPARRYGAFALVVTVGKPGFEWRKWTSQKWLGSEKSFNSTNICVLCQHDSVGLINNIQQYSGFNQR